VPVDEPNTGNGPSPLFADVRLGCLVKTVVNTSSSLR
jgi:hypothetical protein